MLRGNLSTRPFYNERLVTLALVLAGVVALALTMFNVSQIRSLTARRAELQGRIDAARHEAARIRSETAVVYRTIDRPALQRLATAAEEANELIDARVFSWTTFLTGLEAQMPMNVHLVAVAPRVERGVFQVDLHVVAKSYEDVQQFVDALSKTGTFYDVFNTGTQLNESGTFGSTIRTGYRPVTNRSEPPPANGAPRGRP